MPELIIYLLTWLDYRDWLNYSIFLICLPTCSDCSVVEVPEGRYRGHNPKTAPPEKKGKVYLLRGCRNRCDNRYHSAVPPSNFASQGVPMSYYLSNSTQQQ